MLLALEQAQALLADIPIPQLGTENRPIAAALDRILAQDYVAVQNVPNYDNSAMDGYAINSAQVVPDAGLRIVAEICAGASSSRTLGAGECARIMTGSALPPGCDSVVMQENCVREGDQVRIQQWPKPGENIRRAGSDLRAGDLALRRGEALTPVSIGVLALLGFAEVAVYTRPKVGLFSTGDELRQPGGALEAGQVYDSNRFMIKSMLQRLPVDIIDYGCLPDNYAIIEETLLRASEECDCILSSGGVSVGDADFTRDALLANGQIGFYKIAMKPGKPLAFGHLGRACFFGLPGNPVSACVTFHELALPLLERFTGKNTQTKIRLRATAKCTLKKRPGRVDFQRGLMTVESDGRICVVSAGSQSSAVLTAVKKANCFICLEQERGDVLVGEEVWVDPFDTFL